MNIFFKIFYCLIIIVFLSFQKSAFSGTNSNNQELGSKTVSQPNTGNHTMQDTSIEASCHDIRMTSNMKSLNDEIQRISRRVPNGNNNRRVEYRCIGSGTYKGFYYHAGDRFGWMDTSKEIVRNELDAEDKLRLRPELRDLLPKVDIESPGPMRGQLQNGDRCRRTIEGHGYWVEKISMIGETFKPAMASRGVLPRLKKWFLSLKTADGKPDFVKLKRVAQCLVTIMNELEYIANSVGELSLALSDDGSLKIVDCATNSNNGSNTGGEHLYSIARPGLEFMLRFINEQLPVGDQLLPPVEHRTLN